MLSDEWMARIDRVETLAEGQSLWQPGRSAMQPLMEIEAGTLVGGTATVVYRGVIPVGAGSTNRDAGDSARMEGV